MIDALNHEWAHRAPDDDDPFCRGCGTPMVGDPRSARHCDNPPPFPGQTRSTSGRIG